MRAALNALTDELKRLKTTGVKTVVVSDESLAALRKVISAQTRKIDAGQAPVLPTAERADFSVKAPPKPVTAAPVAPKLPPPPKLNLPEGDKATRMLGVRALLQENPVLHAYNVPGNALVFGVGSLDAKIMFIGDAPGPEEASAGEPYMGPAGQLLTRMISAMGLSRAEVFMTTIMNGRLPIVPGKSGEEPASRPPTAEELAYFLPFVAAQIAIIAPTILVVLGATATGGLLGAEAGKNFSKLRGTLAEFAGKPVMVTYSPSYFLRNNSNQAKRKIWEDLLQVMTRAGLPISEKQHGYFLDK
jgi:uracil-DNA glycosylase